MSNGFRALSSVDLTRAVEQLLLPRLAATLRERGAGHCMRVSDLDGELMISLAKGLRREVPEAQVFILANGSTAPDGDLLISSTKLVELRNPLPNGDLRPPLCVFLPANLRTSAEDSFGVATFQEFPVRDSYESLRNQLLERIPHSLLGYVRDALQLLREQRWRWASDVAQVRYLLCAHANGNDGEAFGGALYELGLVPDFKLFVDPTTAYGRVRRNLECVRRLTDGDASVRARVLGLDLVNKGLRRRLAEYLVETGVEDPVLWTRNIVLYRRNWDLSFDKWEFASETSPDKIAFVKVETDLPVVADDETDERLVDFIGQQVLAPNERRKLNVVIEVSPHPGQVQGLDHFTVQIISKDTGPVGVVHKVPVWKTNRTTCNVAFSKLNKVEFEEGWYNIRVQPWTADGDPIPIDEPPGSPARRSNESEPFYVLPEGQIEEEPPQRAVPKAESVEHARIDRQFTAILQGREPQDVVLESVGWAQKNTQRRSTAHDTIEAKFGKEGTFQIAVARWLKIVEERILASPERPVSWRMQIHMGQPQTPTGDISEWPASAAAVRSFLDARTEYFATVTQNKGLVTQGLDFLAAKEKVLAYASAYVDLLKDLSAKVERESGRDQLKAMVALRVALAVDTIRLVIEDYRGHVREAAVIAPTHPLRVLWQLGWAQLGSAWVKATTKGPEEHVTPARDALLRGISSVNFPAMLPISDGRVFVAVDNIHPFWSLYAPATEEDPRGLLGDVCAALGLPEPSIGGLAVTGEVIASRIERYLVQHPYVRTLAINAFNPGRAKVLADALVALQKQEPFKDLRYDLRLFVPDPDAPGVGESITELLAGEGTLAGEAFSVPTGSHVFPKLNVAIRGTADFREDPSRYRSHLSFLFDVFPPEEVGAGKPFRLERTIPLHGLVQDFTVRYRDDETGTGWQRQPRHGTATMIAGAEETSMLLGQLPALLSAAVATVARSTPDFESRPIIHLELDPDERALISEVHDTSDWVFTIDRNMGIEFFDHGGRRDRPDYLIDYTPFGVPDHGHRLVISSRSLAELEAILRPVLQQYGLDAEGRQAVLILEQLRSLSGRLALKLVSSPTARAEALGMALARLYLEHQGALRNQIVVPLDAHLELFQSAKKQAEAIGDEVTLRRTDLALFDLDVSRRTITCNLVEVKCYAQKLGLSGYGQVKENITEQLNQSERILQKHFDPHRTKPDRPDRLLKTRELATLLEFYLDRGLRYHLMDPVAGEEARTFLDVLEAGYTLRFTRSGLVFDFDKPGTEPPEHEVGIEFHRIGRDLIHALVERPGSAPSSDDGGDGGAGDEQAAPVALTSAPIPKLSSAAFLVEERQRVTSVDLGWNGEHRPVTEKPAAHEPDDTTASAPGDSPVNDGDSSGGSSSVADAAPVAEEQAVPRRKPAPTEAPKEPEPQCEDEAIGPAITSREPGAPASGLPCDVVIGVNAPSPQFGVLGEVVGRKIALDLNQTHTISLFGVQGGGKSYTLGSIVEMACMPIPGVNVLPHPLACVIFHYSATLDYKPEFTSMVLPNTATAEVAALWERYGAKPHGLEDVVILAPAAKVSERRAEYPGIQVLPIAFAASELKAAHWKFLMGAVGSQSMYIRQLGLIMKKLRGEITLDGLRQEVEHSGLSDNLKGLALMRLRFAEEYIDDNCRLTNVLRPGRLVIVDLRDELVEKDEALGLFVVLLQMFSETTFEGRAFNKLVVFDEAHKYIDNPDLVAGLIEVVREMRHKGTSIMVASQDPPSVPTSLIELSTQIIMHKFNSPAWLKHVQKANAALDELTPAKLAELGPGEAYVWSSKSTDDAFTRGAVKVRCRPRVTLHGGGTKTAVEE
ncbi:MAG TPA: ATP-binding protein [Myxococcota bacterium]|nr:ATP-binding protein [Myxococcota bacterium]HQK52259.1 ATP-binding protein [Myxococcota bacterium]